jgi:hypothetical protein
VEACEIRRHSHNSQQEGLNIVSERKARQEMCARSLLAFVSSSRNE